MRARNFLAKQDGVVAIEFAFIGPVLGLLTAAIFEAGMMSMYRQNVDYAVERAARHMLTQQVGESDSTTFFDRHMCATVSGFMDCSKFEMSARTVSSYSDIRNATWNAANWCLGGAGEFVLVTMRYDVDTVLQPMSWLNGYSQGPISSSFVIRREPTSSGAGDVRTC